MTKRITTKQFIERSKIIHGDKYDYSETEYIKSSEKVVINCKTHGKFTQAPFSHMSGCGCPKCMADTQGNKLRKTRSQFIQESVKVHGRKFRYKKVKYINSETNVEIYCTKHKLWFFQTPYTHIKGGECPKCRYEKTSKKLSFSTEQFIEKSRKIHGDKYDYSKVKYKNNIVDVIIICKKHKIEFLQTPASHFIGCGCPICAGTQQKTTAEFIKEAKKVHGNKYDYSQTEYINWETKVAIKCKRHKKIFYQRPSGHVKKGYGCPSCGATVSKKEEEIKNWIRSLGVNAEKDNKNILPHNEIDIYLPEYKIGIEYNGLYWHNSRTKKEKYHLNKTKAAEEQNIYLMHFWDFEWSEKQKIVKSIIKNAIGMCKTKIFARKTKLDLNISAIEAKQFCLDNHIHGFRGGKQRIGLRFNNELVSLMITSSTGEMVRFVSKINTQIIGGFSRLLKYSNVTYSFVDRRIFNGNGYLKNGFKLQRVTKPNYFYVKGGSYLGTRQQFQKHKLKNKLEKFNPDLTEEENMIGNGFHRVYDCGNFVMINKNAP